MIAFPRYSPDGKRIAFHSDRSGSMQLWVANEDGSNAIQLTSQPAFSVGMAGVVAGRPADPVYRHCRRATESISWFVPRAANQSRLRSVMSGWSRDGRWIYYRLHGPEGQVWRKPAAGGEPKQVTRKAGIVTCANRRTESSFTIGRATSPPSLWRVPVDGGEETEILHAFRSSRRILCNRPGHLLCAGSERSGERISVIQLLRPATGKVEVVAAIDKDLYYGLTVSPDGRWLLYSQVDQATCDLMLVENFR